MPDPPTSIHYREATLIDAPEIAHVESLTKQECNLAPADRCNQQYLRERWEGYIRRQRFPQCAEEPRILFAAFTDTQMVGFIAGHFSHRYDTQGELQSIHVLKPYQRLSIGANLLHQLAAWFVAAGRKKICVGISPQNPYRRFYEKHGTRYINEHWLVWGDISRILDDRQQSPPG